MRKPAVQSVVYCTTQFEGFHRWPEATSPVTYLRDRHRHIFHVKAGVKVSDRNRQVEFIQLKDHVNEIIGKLKSSPDCETWSCEEWAARLIKHAYLDYCDVSEDGENGAVVTRI